MGWIRRGQRVSGEMLVKEGWWVRLKGAFGGGESWMGGCGVVGIQRPWGRCCK